MLIQDDNRPPSQWLLGRIVKLNMSKDGLVRSVDIETATTKLTRAVQRICVLPIEPIEKRNKNSQEKEQ